MHTSSGYIKKDKTIIKTRRAVASDAAAVAALLYKAFVEYRSLYTERGFEATTPEREQIEDRINKKAVWLVVNGDTIAGTVSVFPQKDQLYVRSLAVNPDARGKGIGEMLMEHVHEMAFASGCSFITLTTTPFLLPAIKLYEKFGFEAQGKDDLFGTPLVWMTKTLLPRKK
jgi:ribosomal protein S18 acetylase RimI-like enzyme